MTDPLQALRETITCFVNQEEIGILVIRASDRDTAVLAQTLLVVADTLDRDVLLQWVDAFESPAAYIAKTTAHTAEELRRASEHAASLLRPALADLPAACTDTASAPAQRLQQMVDHLQSLLPEGDHRMVLAATPLAIATPTDFAQLFASWFPRDGNEPWIDRLRWILREDPAQPAVSAALIERAAPAVWIYDFATASHAAETEHAWQVLGDRTLSKERRMVAVLEIAAMELAHGHLPQALEHYQGLERGAQIEGMLELSLWASQGIAMVHERMEQPLVARDVLLDALQRTEPSLSPTLLVTLPRELARIERGLGELANAEQYLLLADAIATEHGELVSKLQTLLELGEVRRLRERHAEAAQAWELCAALAREFAMDEFQRNALQRLHTHYEALQLHAQTDRVQQALRTLDAPSEERPS